jgi:hypothetical protein
MSIEFGAKPIEFEKGKAGIAVPSKDKLPTVIDTLIAAVRAGELDDLFSQAAKTGSIARRKRPLDPPAGRWMNSPPSFDVLARSWNADDGFGRFPCGQQAELVSPESSQVMPYELIVLG